MSNEKGGAVVRTETEVAEGIQWRCWRSGRDRQSHGGSSKDLDETDEVADERQSREDGATDVGICGR